jgi:hypothetical protein
VRELLPWVLDHTAGQWLELLDPSADRSRDARDPSALSEAPLVVCAADDSAGEVR